MRKLILISALLLVSASAQAGGSSTDPTLAANDPPPAATTATAQPLPPVAHPDAAKPAETPKPQVADSGKPHASRRHVQARGHESDEAKARRIAARYGISW
ncbi:MAG TPA: hypothetical protein VKR55_18180 [Bradyrhizobium sp.]|uniref:hypothetical protein n=1 Tax=Bradyrhizobium sp. TaxID=376 RepID=UPI002B853767|nr:hypothetical protein [Bradyrhizobium sp.]HLZ04060.1 hypothetical protein [Bradyrhizobium sp.]